MGLAMYKNGYEKTDWLLVNQSAMYTVSLKLFFIHFNHLLYQKKSKNRIIRINTGILSNMKQKIKEFYH